MTILVLRHEPFEHLGLFSRTLTEKGVSFHYLDLESPMVSGDYDAMIVLGGPMSANDPLPGLARELRQIDEALKRHMPLLGICLGSQLIAKALGARVYRNAELEIGWEPVELREAGRADPLFEGISSPQPFFHWHGETFDLPEGSEWLASSRKTKHQAYRYGSNVYGLQFHPEVDSFMIDDWASQACNCGDVATLAEPLNSRLHDQSGVADRILGNWLKIAGRS